MNLIFVLILRLGGVHKLRLQYLAFFNPLSPPPPHSMATANLNKSEEVEKICSSKLKDSLGPEAVL